MVVSKTNARIENLMALCLLNKFLIKNNTEKISQDHFIFNEFFQMSKEEIILTLHKLFQKIEEKEHSSNFFFDEASVSLIQKPDMILQASKCPPPTTIFLLNLELNNSQRGTSKMLPNE